MSDTRTGKDGAGGAAALPPLQGFALVAVAIATSLSTFIVVLDLTIANVSIPTIASGLGASPREGTWVITSYAVADAITVLMTGWLSARFGTARILVVAMVWFGLASILCGLSTSLGMLVVFRILQGLAGGPLLPLSQTLLLNNFPKEKAQYGMAIWTVTSVLAPICGPIIGGYICDNWSWPWIFLINIPVALITAFFLWRLLRHRDQPPQHRPADFVGMAMMATWVGATQFMLDRGQDLDWFHSSLIVGLLLVAIIGFISFLIWELTEPNPIVNLRMFRDRSFSTAMVVLSLCFGAFFGSIIISPLWLQTNMGYTPTWAGIAGAPAGMTMFAMAPAIAWLSNRVDTRLLMSVGLFALANAYFWRGQFASNVTLQLVLLAQVGVGFGMSFVFAPAMNIAMASLKPQEMAGATGLIAFTRTISVAIATSATTTHWTDAAVRDRAGIIDRFAGTSAIGQIGATDIPPDQALLNLDQIVQSQAVMLATNDTYILLAVLAAMSAACVWFAPKPKLKSLGR